MNTTTRTMFESAFAEDTYKGLTSYPKYLLSKYIYDEKGDKLFQKIMDMPEYYLTQCEFEILEQNAAEICSAFSEKEAFDLIELGAGDGKKTKILLKELLKNSDDFKYLPIDISQHALDELQKSLKKELPEAKVSPQQGTYFKTLEELAEYNRRKKVILFLGSNIGNLLHKDAVIFLSNIAKAMDKDDMLFMGFDQKKDPKKILDAYNDPNGITEAFNKNLLVRINKELGGDFNPDSFKHWETYDPETGTAKSFLVSSIEQNVKIQKLELEVHFDSWESIHTEISQKYDDSIVKWLASEAGLKVEQTFTDSAGFYKNYIFKKN
ncbi:L-histidine N(alpha)-methyltransferase [Christiangramia fulva]|uniref:L-histidine N(Alpha)-methyltransferase n=1 Tax=Christiangramia fulva TaxID=2126553 RepID=A0A2R3Z5F2_9FLAO|nr:L-histidine N(alpha)-methyltransferase [Christiangramia fulva]AVR45454.1 L-histidine N(alpha)-methyltransferase [Christiangramia fulva]